MTCPTPENGIVEEWNTGIIGKSIRLRLRLRLRNSQPQP